MTTLNKKWLSGLVAGALMAVSAGTLAAAAAIISGLRVTQPRPQA